MKIKHHIITKYNSANDTQALWTEAFLPCLHTQINHQTGFPTAGQTLHGLLRQKRAGQSWQQPSVFLVFTSSVRSSLHTHTHTEGERERENTWQEKKDDITSLQ